MGNILKFLALWMIFFLASWVGLSALGLVPPEIDEFNYRAREYAKNLVSRVEIFRSQASKAEIIDLAPEVVTPIVKENILPERVIIEKIGVDSKIINPESRDVGVLDQALLGGVVRYPGSGGLDDDSNIFLFGHSTTYKVVKNEAFKALNHLELLKRGDFIRIQSRSVEYVYVVNTVTEAETDIASVKLALGEKKITLSTCDTFGGNAKTRRIIVDANYLSSKAIES